MIATNKLPKQILPNDVVKDRTYESRTAFEQHPFASDGLNHHVPTVPAVVTCLNVSVSDGSVTVPAKKEKKGKENDAFVFVDVSYNRFQKLIAQAVPFYLLLLATRTQHLI
jgi:hypothetical protein